MISRVYLNDQCIYGGGSKGKIKVLSGERLTLGGYFVGLKCFPARGTLIRLNVIFDSTILDMHRL